MLMKTVFIVAQSEILSMYEVQAWNMYPLIFFHQ